MSEELSTLHRGISCDGCGATPILGTRFVSSVIYGFDVCETCISDYQRCDFVAFEQPVSAERALEVGPTVDTTIRAVAPRQAVAALRLHQQAPGENKTAAVFSFNFYNPSTVGTDDYAQLSAALADNTDITYLVVHMCGQRRGEQAIASIARGIAQNRSIKRLAWHIGRIDRDTETCKRALRDMIEQNSVLELISITRACHSRALTHQEKTSMGIIVADEAFAQCLIGGLHHNSTLQRVRLECSIPLSNESKKLFQEAAKKNENLVKVYADFYEHDHELELLLEDNRTCWSKRIFEIRHAPMEDRVCFFEEVKELTQMDDPVHPLFYLLRGCPEVLKA